MYHRTSAMSSINNNNNHNYNNNYNYNNNNMINPIDTSTQPLIHTSTSSHNPSTNITNITNRKSQYTYNKKTSFTFYFIIFFVFVVMSLIIVSAIIILIPIIQKSRGKNPNINKPREDDRSGFVDVKSLRGSENILTEIRYFGDHNFVGRPIEGYLAPKCLLSKQSAQQLVKVQLFVEKTYGLTLKIYDCYRPQSSVSDFVRWSVSEQNEKTLKMKNEFYPTFTDAKQLFDEGYIAYRSGHTRGSTIDLTLVPLPVPEQEIYNNETTVLVPCFEEYGRRFRDNSIDMGTGFDCFHAMSHTDPTSDGYELTEQQRQNRRKLLDAMKMFGFKNYEKEWWHYTLIDEPYPDTYFTFLVE